MAARQRMSDANERNNKKPRIIINRHPPSGWLTIQVNTLKSSKSCSGSGLAY